MKWCYCTQLEPECITCACLEGLYTRPVNVHSSIPRWIVGQSDNHRDRWISIREPLANLLIGARTTEPLLFAIAIRLLSSNALVQQGQQGQSISHTSSFVFRFQGVNISLYTQLPSRDKLRAAYIAYPVR